jgi:hypothetical protein
VNTKLKFTSRSIELNSWISLVECIISMQAYNGEFRQTEVGRVQINCLEREDGSGRRFNFKGFVEGGESFTAFFDYELNQGHIIFDPKKSNFIRFDI